MRLAFWRTKKPVARPVLQPGADSPYVPRLGVWMALMNTPETGNCQLCGGFGVLARLYSMGVRGPTYDLVHEGCGAKLVAQLRREREG